MDSDWNMPEYTFAPFSSNSISRSPLDTLQENPQNFISRSHVSSFVAMFFIFNIQLE
jgi:hypothetical protein